MPHYLSLWDLEHDQKLATALGDMVVVWTNAERVLLGTMARVLGARLNFVQPAFYRLPTFESRSKFIKALIDDGTPQRVTASSEWATP